MYQRRKTKDVPQDKINKFNREVNIWITHAIELGIDVYVLGITGPRWDNTVWEKLVSQGVLHESKHRFCTLGLKLGEGDKPSNVCMKILSTWKIGPTPCKCGIPFKEHDSDWNHKTKEIDIMNHRHAIQSFCDKMSITGLFHFNKVPGRELMFPTEERVEWKRKRKENKEKGIEVKKKVKVVENHHDDCGTDLSGLGPEDTQVLLSHECEYDSDEENLKGINMYWCKGSDWEDDFVTPFAPGIQEACDVYHMMDILSDMDEGTLDLVEICGGMARTSTLAVRRRLRTGTNFDLVTNWDLNDTRQQNEVKKYFRKFKPLVAIMGPTCKPFGKLANYNYWHNYEAWLKSYQEAAPHGRFCGELALLQDDGNRYFICEQPKDSWLFTEQPWPIVMNRNNTTQVIFDQCRVGLRTKEGLLAMKPTVLVSNSEILLEPFRNLRCTGNHEHGHLIGGRAAAAQVWTWELANRLVEGVIRLKRHLRKISIMEFFATVGSGPNDPDKKIPKRL